MSSATVFTRSAITPSPAALLDEVEGQKVAVQSPGRLDPGIETQSRSAPSRWTLETSAPIEAKPWFCTRTTVKLDLLLDRCDELLSPSSGRSRPRRGRIRPGRVRPSSPRGRRRSRNPCTSSRTRRGSPSGRGSATACAGLLAWTRRRTRRRLSAPLTRVDGADDLGLGGQRQVTRASRHAPRFGPTLRPGPWLRPGRRDRPTTLQCLVELLEHGPGVADEQRPRRAWRRRSEAMLQLTNRTPSTANAVRDAVVKSDHRVPTPITTSAVRARALAAVVPVAPMAPTDWGWS